MSVGRRANADMANIAGRPYAPAAAAVWLTAPVHDALPPDARPAAVAVGGHARAANARAVEPRLTYILNQDGHCEDLMVPKGAEILLETRLPYLDAAQRREVLRTTALPSGYVLLDGFEQWGRLHLFAAANGYGAFDSDVTVTMNAADGGFAAADTWRNDISGRGGLVKRGSGALSLTGANRHSGGTVLEEGTLTAGSTGALGHGDVRVEGGTLRVAPGTAARVRGAYAQASGTTLEVTLRAGRIPALAVDRRVLLGRDSALSLRLDADCPPAAGTAIPVIWAPALRGQFGRITVQADGYRAVPVYTAQGLSVRLIKR